MCVKVRTRVFENKSEPMGGCGQCRTSKNVYTTQEECKCMQIKTLRVAIYLCLVITLC